jgi:leader peptidase (prepilin peptidase)/N-methyltransferase
MMLRVGLRPSAASQPAVSHSASSGIAASGSLSEYLTAIGVTLWAALATEDSALIAGAILGWWLLVRARIDWRHLLPDALTLPLAGLGLAAMAFLRPEALAWHVAGAIAGYVAFRLIALAYRQLHGREGLGQGDAKLMAAAGAWVGLEGLASVILIGALAGLFCALSGELRGNSVASGRWLPFGSFLCLGIWVTWLHGPVPITR